MANFRISDAAGALHGIGVRFHARGVLKDGTGAALFDFYKTDWLAPSDADKIRALCPKVQFRESRAGYAPELRGVYICFPKAAWHRAAKAGKAVSA